MVQQQNSTGYAPNGKVVARYSASDGTYQTTTTTMPLGTTTPQNTQGIQLLSVTFTPKSSSNFLIFRAQVAATCLANPSQLGMALFRTGNANAVASAVQYSFSTMISPIIYDQDTARVTTSLTYTLRAGPVNATTAYFCGNASGRLWGGIWQHRLMVWEIAP